MTIEITEFRCRTCGHLLGEEEYRHACSNHDKDRQAIREELREELREDIRSEQQEKHQQEIRKKNEEIESLKSQNEQTVSRAVDQALRRSYEEWRQKEKEYQLHIERVQKDNMQLKNTLDSIPPERKGTAGEIILTEDLRKAFPIDDLEEKRVGEGMPDTIQTIVTENGERIATQILWDRKTGDITPLDIKKAKRYKEKYNTDYCILVSSKPIAAKDSKGTEGLIGRRDGIMLLHKSIAVEMAEEIRNFIIKETRLVKK